MILLPNKNLQKGERFTPESMSLSLEERNSSASMNLGPEAPQLQPGDWVLDDCEPGKGIIWRVRSVSYTIETQTRTVSLEHIIQTLKDVILFGEHKSEDISGGSTCTARQAVEYALGGQSTWRLGDLAENASQPYSFNGDSIYAAIETVCSTLEDVQWEYDLSSLPFTLHIRKQPESAESEMRVSRNISGMKIAIDRSQMYTRHYPIGADDLHLPEGYLSRNEGIWGRKDKTETESGISDAGHLRAWSRERLNRHCEPIITVTVDGLILAGETGESLDDIKVGRRCRIPLPEYGTTVSERVVKISWSDKLRAPTKATVSMANQVTDVASILRQETASAASSGRRSGKKSADDHAWFVDTTDHVAMVAEAVAGEGASSDWSRVAEVLVDGQGVHQRVTKAEGDIVTAEARIDVTEDAITQAVTKIDEQGEELRAAIRETAEGFETEISKSQSRVYQYVKETADEYDREIGNLDADLRSEILATATRIMFAVEKKSDNFFQWDDPLTNPPEGKTVTDGSIWVKSNDIRDYGDAEVFTWGDLGGFSWASFYGSEIYIYEDGEWKKAGSEQLENINRTRIDQTDDHIALIADSFGGSWSAFVVTAGRILSEVNNLKSDMGSVVEQTAEMIRSAVFTANSTMYSEILQTATNILQEVANTKSGLEAHIETTAESIWTEVGIKATVFRQWTDPAVDPATKDHVKENDLWVVDNGIDTYADANKTTWGQLGQYDWMDFYGKVIKIRKPGGYWKTIGGDQLQNYEHTFSEENRDRWRQVAEDLAGNRAELELTKSSFASRIRTMGDEIGSAIEQTASQIRLEVHAAKSSMYSEIVQTASQIRLSVNNAISSVRSSIDVESNRISLVVEGTGRNAHIKPASIVQSINEDESEIVISANKINLDGLVHASDLTTDYFAGKIADITAVSVKALNCGANGVGTAIRTASITSPAVYVRRASGGSYSISNPVVDIQITGPTNNQYTLQKKMADSNAWVDVQSFSRAVTGMTPNWSLGKLTVTANPQGDAFPVLGLITEGSWSGRTYSGKVRFYYGHDSSANKFDTGLGFSLSAPGVTIDIDSSEYNSGQPGHISSFTQLDRISNLMRNYSRGYVYFHVTAGGEGKWYRMTTPN